VGGRDASDMGGQFRPPPHRSYADPNPHQHGQREAFHETHHAMSFCWRSVATIALRQSGVDSSLAAPRARGMIPQIRGRPRPGPSCRPNGYGGQGVQHLLRSAGQCLGPAAPEQRARRPEKIRAAPPILEFDAAGNFIQGWGGTRGPGYDWPETEHGIYAEPQGFSSGSAGNGKTDNHLLKFTKAGKFVMQIGHKGREQGQQGPR